MAQIKITALPAYADPASTDVLPIVDVGADITKKISIQDLLENAGSGTAAAPGIAFDGDSDTGIYRPGANQLALSTNGTQRINIEADGDINIDNGGVFYDATNNRLAIGTTSPDETLEIANSAAPINGNTTIGQVERIGRLKFGTKNTFGNRGPTASIDHVIRTDNWGLQAFSSQIAFSTAQNTAGALTQRAVITNQGYFGVGTTTPSAGIHVNAPASQSPAIFEINTSEAARIDSAGRLLVGTSTARVNFFNTTLSSILQIEGASSSDSNNSRFTSQTFGTAGIGGPIHIFAKHRSNSVGGTTVVQNGDDLGVLSFQGSDGTEFVAGAQIRVQVDGTPGANDMPGCLIFSTTADGASSPTEQLRITSDRYVRLASGTGGIQFNGDTAAANALDDYEEGTCFASTGNWTNYGSSYVKIGRLVFISLRGQLVTASQTFSLPFAANPSDCLSGVYSYGSTIGYIYDGSSQITLQPGFIKGHLTYIASA